MRHPTLLAWGLAATAATVGLGAFVYAPDSRQSASRLEHGLAEPTVQQPTPSVDTTTSESGAGPNEATPVHTEASTDTPADRGTTRRRPRQDEAASREKMRVRATEDVEITYSLLLEDLRLSPRETEDLTALLIELQVNRQWDYYQRGKTISDQERADKIEAVIGREKLEQFLALEQSGAAYYDTYQIASLLRRRDAPLNAEQRDGVLQIMTEVRARYPTMPPTDLDKDSVEWIERVLWQHDELDRHVIELAPSALSPNQVLLLFEQYQRMSRQRFDSVERYKKLKAERPDEFRGWAYSPGNWN